MAAAIAPDERCRLRPEKPKVDPRRAKLMLGAELGWLDGYPTDPGPEGLGWQRVRPGAAPSTLRVNGERLHKSNWALRKIYRDFYPVLPKVLGEAPEAWLARTQAMLDALVPSVQSGEAAPPWSTVPRPGPLAPLLRALGWRWAGAPETARALQSQIEQTPERWAALLARPGGLLTAMILLGWMTEERPERVLPALSLLIEPADAIRSWAYHRKFAPRLAEFLDSTAPQPDYPSPAAFDWFGGMQALALELNALPKAGRRRALLTLAALRPPIAAYQAWWSRFAELERQVFELPRPDAPITSRSPPHHWRDSVRGRVLKFQGEIPAPWHPREALDAVRVVAREEGAGEVLLQALPLLEKIQGGDALCAFLAGWTRVPTSPRRLRHLKRWLRSLRQAARADRLDAWSQLWQPELKRWQSPKGSPEPVRAYPRFPEPDGSLDDEPEHTIARFYDWLDAAPRSIRTDEAGRLAGIFAVTDDFTLAERLLATTPEGWISSECMRARATIAGFWSDERMKTLEKARESELTLLARALPFLRALGHGPRLERLPQAVLIELGGALSLLASCGASPPTQWQLSQDAAWIAESPPELHEALADLNLYHPDARGWARRAIHKLCPPDEALDREIAALEERAPPPESPMGRRLGTLRGRRAATRALSEAQTRRLVERARQNADQAFAARLRERMRASVRQRLPDLMGAELPPERLDRPEIWEIILGLGDIGPSIRALAFRLLQRRNGPPPWDLREEPANRAFLDRLAARGVRTEPWLAERRQRLPGDERIELRFEGDPLEILQMGAHFGTCLSPGEMNYYSAVVNAADINKRVVYARGPDGGVVGRSLLALTDEGNVLVFTPYCHRPELGLGDHVGAFAKTLSEEMGTTLVSEGKPRTLLAGRWYDDGPRDLDNLHELFGPESPLVRSLETLSPAELVPALRAVLRPAQLAGPALTHLLALEVFRRRPELLVPLVPEYLSSPATPTMNRLAAAVMLHDGGEAALARSLLPANRELSDGSICCGYVGHLEGILRLDPWFVLRVLRYRGRHYFSNDDAWAKARALDAVGRPAQALRSYREALAALQDYVPDWKPAAQARLAELERQQAERRR